MREWHLAVAQKNRDSSGGAENKMMNSTDKEVDELFEKTMKLVPALKKKIIKNCEHLRKQRRSYMFSYRNKPDVKERIKNQQIKYRNKPEARKRILDYLEEYKTRPDVIQRRKLYYLLHKEEKREYDRNRRNTPRGRELDSENRQRRYYKNEIIEAQLGEQIEREIK